MQVHVLRLGGKCTQRISLNRDLSVLPRRDDILVIRLVRRRRRNCGPRRGIGQREPEAIRMLGDPSPHEIVDSFYRRTRGRSCGVAGGDGGRKRAPKQHRWTPHLV